jgi:hypothetical protein
MTTTFQIDPYFFASVEFADRVKYLAVLTLGFKAQGTMRENMIKDVRKFENLIELTFAGSEGSGENDLAPRQEVDGEPRLVPGRPCPLGECTYRLRLFAGLVAVDVQSWQIKPAESLRYEVMDEEVPGD